ncbi:MAG: deoxyribodipyrimidine photo-lyase, partial [Actinobacteria bacterium]|nr:deoxyribodipyrimidine photo-lyase [Actinomycetota bacterium]
MAASIIWFRRDLRLADHPALTAALAHGVTTPLFVLDPLFVQRSGAARL